MKKKKTAKKVIKTKEKFVYVDKKYYGNKKTNQYYKDLKEEREYVSRHVHLVRKPTKIGEREYVQLEVYDRITGKKLSLDKFRKYFKIENHEFEYLKKKSSELIGLNSVFQHFVKDKLFTILIDSENLDELDIYDIIYLNNNEIPLNELMIFVMNFLGEIQEYLPVYKLFLYLQVDYNECALRINNELLDKAKQRSIGRDLKGYTDSNKNFILFSS